LQSLFGVFDGHGGAKAAEFVAENLDKNIIDEVMRRGDEEIEEAVKQGYFEYVLCL
jgi:protein phosphatase 1L